MMDWQRLIDLGVLTPQNLDQARGNAIAQGLMNASAAFHRAGAPSRNPGGQPLDLAPVFANYQNAMANSVKQGLMLKQLERQEEQHAREKANRERLAAHFASKPKTVQVQTGEFQDGDPYKVTDLSYTQGEQSGGFRNLLRGEPGQFDPAQTVTALRQIPVTREKTIETNPNLLALPAAMRSLASSMGQSGFTGDIGKAMFAAALKQRPTGAYNSYLLDGKPAVLNKQEVSTAKDQGRVVTPYSTAKNNEGTYTVTMPGSDSPQVEFLNSTARDELIRSGAEVVPYSNPSARRYQNLGPYKLPDGTIIEGTFDRRDSERFYEKDGKKLPIPKGSIPITEASIALERTKGIPTFGQFTKLRSDLLDDRISLENMSKYMGNIGDAEQGYSRLADQFSAWTKTFLSSNAKTYKLSESELALKVAKGQLQGLLGKFRIETVGGGTMTEQDALRVISNLGGDVNLLQNKEVVAKQLKRLYQQKLMAFEQKRESYEIVRDRGYSSYKPIKPIPHNNILNPQTSDTTTVIEYDSKGNRID